ncbi:MAG TPA: DUF4142 domain-containing protein [Dokdonella sp.]
MTRIPMLLAAALAASSGAAMAADQQFAEKAAQGGMAEVALGKLGATQGSTDAIKTFAQTMVDDHGKANDELKEAAEKDGITLPSDVSAEQRATAQRLSALKGQAFDREFVRVMVHDHEQTVALFEKEAKSGTDPNLKAFAHSTLPTLKNHLHMAKHLQNSGEGSHASH